MSGDREKTLRELHFCYAHDDDSTPTSEEICYRIPNNVD